MAEQNNNKNYALKGIKVLDYCMTQCAFYNNGENERMVEVHSTVFLTPKNNASASWQIRYKSYLNSLLAKYTPEQIDSVVINDFLGLVNVKEIRYSILRNNDINMDIMSISVICSKDQKFNLMIPGFEFHKEYMKIGEHIKERKNDSFINEYQKHCENINNIYIIPSYINSSASYIENDVDTTGKNNNFYIFNFHSKGKEDLYLNNDDIILKILEHFYSSNIDFIDGYATDDNKVTLKFSNGKNIVIEDKDLIPKLTDFINEFNNTLIDIKIGKRKVLKNERNDNGKNG